MYITYLIGYLFLKILIFVICFVSYRYCVLVFVLLYRVTNYSKRIRILGYFTQPYT